MIDQSPPLRPHPSAAAATAAWRSGKDSDNVFFKKEASQLEAVEAFSSPAVYTMACVCRCMSDCACKREEERER